MSKRNTQGPGTPKPVLELAVHNAGWNSALAERRRRAFELRQMRRPYRAIADELGVSVSRAYEDVMAVLGALLPVEDAEAVRRQEADNLDRMESVLLDAFGSEPSLALVDRLLAIQARRSKLLGLDAPAKVEAHHEVMVETTTDRELRQMMENLRPELADARPDLG